MKYGEVDKIDFKNSLFSQNNKILILNFLDSCRNTESSEDKEKKPIIHSLNIV